VFGSDEPSEFYEFLISLPAALGPEVHSGFNRNWYDRNINNGR
jgi:hypothetical protein